MIESALPNPVAADLDGDGTGEVIFSSWPQKSSNQVGQLHILRADGTPLFAVDLPTPAGGGWNGGLGAPTLARLAGAPTLSVVIGTAHTGVVAYDLPGTERAAIRWGTGRGGLYRAGMAQGVVTPAPPPPVIPNPKYQRLPLVQGGANLRRFRPARRAHR